MGKVEQYGKEKKYMLYRSNKIRSLDAMKGMQSNGFTHCFQPAFGFNGRVKLK
jgi:hypothetical protein